MTKQTKSDVEERLQRLLNLAEPYMKKGVHEDWQEYIAEVQSLHIAIRKLIDEARIDELEKISAHETWEIIEKFEKGKPTEHYMRFEDVKNMFIDPVSKRLNHLKGNK